MTGQLTAADEQLLAWLGRVGFATAEQLRRRWPRTRASMYRRLGWLAASGLVTAARPLRGHGVYLPTSDGLAWSPISGGVPKVSTPTLAHDIRVVDVLVGLELDGRRVLTVRELRHHTLLHGQPGADPVEPDIDYRVEVSGIGGWHYPDLVVEEPDGRRVAVEIELTPKAPRRLRAIIGAWVAAPASQYAGVIYHASDAALPALRAAVADAYAEDIVRLQPLQGSAASVASARPEAADGS